MSPIDWAMRPLHKYADFTGRASRPEYWWFYLSYLIAVIIASIIDSLIGSNLFGNYGIVSCLLLLGAFLPSLAAGARRLHDTDRSGWWLLIAFVPIVGIIVLIVFLASAGTPDPNQYGEPEATPVRV